MLPDSRSAHQEPLLRQVRAASAALERPAVVSGRGRDRRRTDPRPAAPVGTVDLSLVHRGVQESAELSDELNRVLTALRTPSIWLSPDGRVLRAHPAVEAMRVIRGGRIRVPEIIRLVDAAVHSGEITGDEVTIRRSSPRGAELMLRVRIAPMATGAVLVLIEDLSEATRLDNVRRDFVANVSHEIKTPVGALSLLAEAVSEAQGDPATVAHFAERMRAEVARLISLVDDLLDLSRIEGIDPLTGAKLVQVDGVVTRAIEDTATLATANGMSFLRGGTAGLTVLGIPNQLVAAVRNLIANAINYSPHGTKVAISTSTDGRTVSIAVTDQGIGIPRRDLARVFERFYRVDPARSRNTGGTGLGLAIVKHVCANHGGDCTVWSKPREGSTFTVRLPEFRGTGLPAGGELAGGDGAVGDVPPAAAGTVSSADRRVGSGIRE
ncbi:MAG: sensor histidine kinase [Candidatus Nanopelagicales bacterium]